ncbi:MAG: D-glycero-beta-D-manno-heptose-7-phosphate kinase [Crocinitomicaceae bacterium]|nr:D-glycero-beta-D-manno-heptose-7-phosphate kinase [Crocinitomicaceae bacterium]
MNFRKIFESFKDQDVLIIGDVMIDSYVEGKVNRISPEAPVPILNFAKRENRLGGAANVALNIHSMGANPIICSVIGNDENADVFLDLLKDENISAEGIERSSERMTTVKTRIIGNNQQMIRIDEEDSHFLSGHEEEKFLNRVEKVMDSNTIQGIIFQDYNKGVLTEKVIQKITDLANSKGIITTVDPKKLNFYAYENVTLFKPNLKELKEGMGVEFRDFKEGVLNSSGKLREKLNAKVVFTTLSEHGVFITDENDHFFVPAHVRNIADVSGAGDTVISVATLCMIAELDIKWVAELANLAGGMVCERVGVVSIDREALLNEVMKIYS